jgi:hypothetical protein
VWASCTSGRASTARRAGDGRRPAPARSPYGQPKMGKPVHARRFNRSVVCTQSLARTRGGRQPWQQHLCCVNPRPPTPVYRRYGPKVIRRCPVRFRPDQSRRCRGHHRLVEPLLDITAEAVHGLLGEVESLYRTFWALPRMGSSPGGDKYGSAPVSRESSVWASLLGHRVADHR